MNLGIRCNGKPALVMTRWIPCDMECGIELRARQCHFAIMATVTIPDDLHAKLSERAQRNGRSVDQQIIADLANGTSAATLETGRPLAARDRMRKAIEETDKIRAGMKSFMTAEEIDIAIAEGKA
ncbi:hypothetical protein BH18VER1_BH18VER1_21580 [soil metagenome]